MWGLRWWWFIRWDVLGAVDLVVHVRIGVVEGPDDLFVRRDPNEHPVPSRADEGIAVQHPLGATKAI